MHLTSIDLNPNISWLTPAFQEMHSLEVNTPKRVDLETKLFNITKTEAVGIHKIPLLNKDACQNLVNILKNMPIDWAPIETDLYGAPEVRFVKVSEILAVKTLHLILESIKHFGVNLSGGLK